MKRLRDLLPIKPGEGYITAVMFSYIFGVLFFYYVLDPIRKGLFLKNFPAAHLPYAYFLTALIAGLIATLTFKLSRRLSPITLLTCVNAAIIGTLFYFRWAMGRDIWYLAYVYFFYVKTVSVLSTAQFWLLAGYIYDSRQAKRLYSFLGLGAIAGAIAGSFVPAFLSKRMPPQSMVVLCIAVCAVLIVLSHVAWRHRRPNVEKKAPTAEPKEKNKLRDIWPAIFGSPHLSMLSALIFLTLIASQIADWQVDATLQAAFGEDQLGITQFTGRLSFVTNILAVVVQLFVTNIVLNRLGVRAAILFLPAFLFLSSTGFFLYPHLLSAAFARGSDTVFRYSLNRAGIEMLYLPLPPAVRSKLKLFVDVFVDRTGRAVAGIVILLFASSYFPFGARGTAAVAMGLTFGCILVCMRLSRTYVDAFRQQLARRQVELEDFSRYVTDPAAVQMLIGALQGPNERQILYALRLLQSARNVDFSTDLLPLLGHASPHVREQAVHTLQAIAIDYTPHVEPLLEDPADDVRQAAIGYLCSTHPDGAEARIESFLKDERGPIRIAAASWVAAHPLPGFQPSAELIRDLSAIEGDDAVGARVAGAALAVQLPAMDAVPALARLLEDANPAVSVAAAKAAGTAGHLKLAFNVASMLATPKRRSAARAGLLCYGERIVGTLGDVLRDPHGDPVLRREIPWVLGRISAPATVGLLTEQLGAEDPALRYRSIKALNRLHETDPKLQMPQAAIEKATLDEIREYYRALALSLSVDGASSGGSGLLDRALRERMDQKLEMIFRLLGLEYSQKDIYFAYLALKGKQPERRNAAIELLDNMLPRPLKPLLLPLLEQSSVEDMLNRAERTLSIRRTSREEALRDLLEHSDSWLMSCALHEIGEARMAGFKEACRNLLSANDALVRQTAAWAYARLN